MTVNPFNTPLVPMLPAAAAPGVMPPWNPLTPPPQKPSTLDPFFARMHQQPPGSKFLAALHPAAAQAPAAPPQQMPAPQTPNASAYDPNSDPALEMVRNQAAAAQAEHQNALTQLASAQPPDINVPAYQKPANEKADPMSTIGHLLAGLISPRLAPFAQASMAHDEQTRLLHDQQNQHAAEIQQQADEADAARKQHYAELSLSKATALAEATGKDADTAVNNYSKQVEAAARTRNAVVRTQNQATDIISKITARADNTTQKNAMIAETAKRDANTYAVGLGRNAAANAAITEHYWAVGAQDMNRLQVAHVHSDTAVQIASQRVRFSLIEQQMRDNTLLANRMSADKAANLRAQVTAMKDQLGQIITAAGQPGASEEIVKRAEEVWKPGGLADQLAQRVSAESGGAIITAETAPQQDLRTAHDTAYAESLSVPGYNAAPQAAGGGSEPAAIAAAVAAAIAASRQDLPGGTPQSGAQPQQPGTPQHPPTVNDGSLAGFLGLGGAHPAPATGTQPTAGGGDPEVEHVKALIAAHPGDKAGVANAVRIFMQRHPGMTPQQATQLLGVGVPNAAPAAPAQPHAAPQPHAAAPAAVHGPIAGLSLAGAPPQSPTSIFGAPTPTAPPGAAPASPTAPPTAAPQQHAQQQTPQNAQQGPAQYASALVQSANAQDKAAGKPLPPVDQQVRTLSAALMKKFPGLSPQMAGQIATNAVQAAAASGNPAVHALSGAGGAIGNAASRFGSALGGAFQREMHSPGNDFTRGGSNAAPRPPGAGL